MARKPEAPALPVVTAAPREVAGEYAIPVETFCAEHQIPRSTFDKLCSEGKGPRRFKVGRRLFVRRVDGNAWFDRLAVEELA